MELKWFVIEITWLQRGHRMDFAPEEFQTAYFWIVGFDTAHGWDTLERWPKFMVEGEAKRLAQQLQNPVIHEKEEI